MRAELDFNVSDIDEDGSDDEPDTLPTGCNNCVREQMLPTGCHNWLQEHIDRDDTDDDPNYDPEIDENFDTENIEEKEEVATT